MRSTLSLVVCARLLASGLMSVLALSVKANPTGGTVVAGAAEISSGAGTLTIQQGTARAVLNWEDFSIGAGELVRFVQPDATSATLNRVIGGNPSSLLGDIEANGRVFLINPNGVLVGRDARIDAAGFLASTLNVTNEQFLAGGDLVFSGDSTAAVQNLGAIDVSGGDIFLIARKVENLGRLSARDGTIGLAAGSEVLLTTGGDQRVFVRAGTMPGEVVNAGEIASATAELKAAGGNPYALAINNTGVVRANGTATRDGQIWLVAGAGDELSGRASNIGELTASDADGRGGFIETSGETVELAGAVRTGAGGRWLIDPTDVTIDADFASTIVSSLNSGTNVSVEADNNITVAANVAANGAGDLDLKADIDRSGEGTVSFGSGIKITNTGGGDVNIFYNPASYAAPTNYAGNVTLSGGGKLTAYMWVHDVDDLQAIATNLAGTYALSGNIDASATAEWNGGKGFEPIGTATLASSPRFRGVFDGRGHTITGLTVNRPDTNYVGLFGAIDTTGWVRDVGLVGGGMIGKSSVGGLAGQNSGVIERSYATGGITAESNLGGLVGFNREGSIRQSYATGVVTGGSYAGGLVGFNHNADIRESYATGQMSGTRMVGGLVGGNSGTSTIEDSYATGAVTTTDAYTGGLVGDNSATIRRSHATGDVRSENYFVGGLVGQSLGYISQSYATGDVEGEKGYIGGLVGQNYGRISQSYATGDVAGEGDRIGGLVGANSSRIGQSYATGDVSGTGTMIGGLVGFSGETGGVDQSYATGVVTGGGWVGGLVGRANAGFTVTRSYWNADNTAEGGAVGTGAVGLTTAEFQSGALPAEFDERFWEASVGQYPVFKAILPAEPDNTLSGTFAGAGAGVELELVIGGATVATTTTTEGGEFRFEYEGNFAQGSMALVYVAGGGAAAANRLVPLHSTLMGDVELLTGWVWATSGASTLTGLLADLGATLGGLENDGILFSLPEGSLSLADGIGLRLDLSATNFDFNTALDLTGHTMRLRTTTGFGVFTATGALNFGTFIFESGQWTQSAATLPEFTAEDFRLQGGRFLRTTGGDGSEASPYLLADIYGVQGITSVGGGLHYALSADVDASVTAGWNDGAGFVPLGGGSSFSGSFDGRGHEIEGLTIERPGTTNVGLFGWLRGSVRDLGLVDASVRGGTRTGGLTGWNDGASIENSYVHGAVAGDGASVGGLVGSNYGEISGSHSMGTVTGTNHNVGGLVGENRGAIDESFSLATVTGTVYLGGLVGWQTDTGEITSSYATGDVAGDGSVGGLVGWNYGLIEESFARGSVTADEDYAGGLAAANMGGTIRRSEASGSVQGAERIGGLVGYSEGEIVQSHASGAVDGARIVGGLVGWNVDDGAIRQSYATGDVSGEDDSVGGLAGMNTGAIRQSYATGEASGAERVGGLVGYHAGAISESYATGKVTGTGIWVGGLVGYNLTDVGTVDHSYWDTQTTGRETSGGGTGMTTAELQSGELPAGFDAEVWDAAAGAYPVLKGAAPVGPANLVTGTYAGVGEGVGLTLAIGGQVVATTTTGPGGVFSFGFEGSVTENAPALVYVTGGGTHAANRVVPLQGWLTADVGLLADWVWVTSRATTLSGLLEEMRIAVGGLVGDGVLYSFDGDKPVLAGGIGLRLDTHAFYFTFDTALDLTGHALHLSGWTEHAGSSSLKVGTFILDGGGRWVQNAAELPEFAAADFQVKRGSFLRSAGGDGSEAAPWVLVDVYGLQGVFHGASNAKHYVLGNDIDASGAANWNDGGGFKPIGNRLGNEPFQGRFDGNGHTISGLTIDTNESSAGLFGFIGRDGWVGDLVLAEANVTGASAVGAVAGTNFGTIERVEVRGGQVTGNMVVGGLAGVNWGNIADSLASAAVSGSWTLGGLAGENGENGRIERAGATGDVTASGGGYVGGLVGENRLGGAIAESWASGDVAGASRVGGLVGQNTTGTIERSFAEGAVTATGDDAGGLIGRNAEQGVIAYGYATGAVKGASRVGGLVGTNEGAIDQTYATGLVTATGSAGGLTGSNLFAGTIANSYWDWQTTGQTTSAGSNSENGLTTVELRSGTLPGGFDVAVWSARAGRYPPLRWTLPPSSGNIVTGALVGAGAGVDLTLVVGGAAVAMATTDEGGWFTFEFAEDYAVGTTALIYVNGEGAFAGNRLLPLQGEVTGGLMVDPGWVWAVSGATTLGELIEDFRAARGALSEAGLLYSVENGRLGLAAGIGLRLDLTAGHFDFDAGLDLTGRTLQVASAGSLTATGAMHAGTFILKTGNWEQNAATLPEFTATDFRIEGGRFLRAQGGDGTEATPWLLVDIYGLQGLATVDLAANYALAADIDASGTENWYDGAGFLPLGADFVGFSGVFDGRGHVISGLVVDRPDSMTDVGLFALVSWPPFDGDGHEGRIFDVGLVGGRVTGGMAAVGGLAGSNYGTIRGGYVTGMKIEGNFGAGGLVGVNSGTIERSYADATVAGSESSFYIGGLVGSSSGTIRSSYASGVVTGSYDVGGLVGGNSGVIEKSYATATVTATDADAGGLAGLNFGHIRQSYATGAVTGADPSSTGGLVGFGFEGFGTVTDSYWDKETTGQATSFGSPEEAGLTTVQMRNAASFVGWDIDAVGGSDDTWRIYEGTTAPLLKAFLTPLTVTGRNVTISYNGAATHALEAGDYDFSAAPKAGGVLGSGVYIAASANAGSYSVGANSLSLTGLYSHQQGYDLVIDGSLTIAPKVLTARLTGPLTKIYDGTLSALLTSGDFELEGLVGSESFTITRTDGVYNSANVAEANMVTAALAVGDFVAGEGTVASNYVLPTEASGVGTITPRAVVVKASEGTSTYGDASADIGFSAEGLVSGETVAVLTGLSTDTPITATTNAGSYTLSVIGTLTNGNYTITERRDGTWVVSPKEITVMANGGASVYGDTDLANPGFTAEGLVNGETVAVLTGLENSFGITNTTNAGSYTLSVTGTLTNGNYTVTERRDGTWVVSPTEITVAANGGTSVYGDTGLANPGFTAEGLVNGETVAVLTGLSTDTPITATTNAGSYTLSVIGTLTNGNYTITERRDGTWVVSPKEITVMANGGASVYGDTDLANPGFTAEGLVNGETVAVLTGLENSFGITNTTNAGSYTLSVTGTLTNGNYTVTERRDGTWVVSPTEITVAANGGTSVYGDTGLANPGFTAEGLVNGETVAVLTGLENSFGITNTTDAGSYTLSVTGTLTNGNYTITERRDGTWVVSPKEITVTANGGASVYGDTGLANPGFTAEGLVNGETVAVLTGLENSFGITNTTNAGSYTLSVIGTLTNGNYTVTERRDGTWVVSPKEITVAANGGASVYGDTDLANPGFTAEGLVNGETVAVLTGLENSFGITNTTNAGSHTLSVIGTLTNGNYTVTARHDGTWIVSPKDITVTAGGGTSVYGEAPVGVGLTADGLVNGETVAVLTGLTTDMPITATTNAGSYTLSVMGTLTNGNYRVTARNDGTWVVSPKEITVAANGGASVYGDTDLANPGFTAEGLVNGETVAVLRGLENSFGITNTTDAGSHTLSVVGTLTNGNYRITTRRDGTWLVSPKGITVTANGGASVYGDADLANPGFTAEGLVNGETVAVLRGLENSFGITNTTDAGSHTLSVVGTLTNGNYRITTRHDGTWVVSPKDLIVTVNDAERGYNQPNPEFTARFEGLVNGESADVVEGLVFFTPATRQSPAGEYVVTASGGSARNYTLHYVDGRLTITRSGIDVDGATVPIVDVEGEPAVGEDHAVVERGGRRTLIPLITEDEGEGRSVEDAIAAELSRLPVPVFEPAEPSVAPNESGLFRSSETSAQEAGVLAQTSYSEFLEEEEAQ